MNVYTLKHQFFVTVVVNLFYSGIILTSKNEILLLCPVSIVNQIFAWFTIDTEKNSKMSLLDINIIRKQGKFSTTVYQKPIFIGFMQPFL